MRPVPNKVNPMKAREMFRIIRGKPGWARVLVLVMVAAGAAWAWPVAAAAGAQADTANRLQQKMDRIQILRNRLKDRVAAAVDLVQALDAKQRIYEAEIRKSLGTLRHPTPAAVLAVPRIRYNLTLIGRISAYRAAILTRIDYFRLGNERLTYLLRQAGDDLTLARTFARVNADTLATHIDAVSAELQAGVSDPLFDAAHLRFPDAKSEWGCLGKRR